MSSGQMIVEGKVVETVQEQRYFVDDGVQFKELGEWVAPYKGRTVAIILKDEDED